jgi:acyl-CoA hydrolase
MPAIVEITGGLPPLATKPEPSDPDLLRLVDMVFPGQTNHYGTLYGGDALKMI